MYIAAGNPSCIPHFAKGLTVMQSAFSFNLINIPSHCLPNWRNISPFLRKERIHYNCLHACTHVCASVFNNGRRQCSKILVKWNYHTKMRLRVNIKNNFKSDKYTWSEPSTLLPWLPMKDKLLISTYHSHTLSVIC
jgi:hypothetical protein